MRRKRIFWQLLTSYLVVAGISFIVFIAFIKNLSVEDTPLTLTLWTLGLGVVLGAVTWFLSKRLSRPLESMRSYAEQFAEGRFGEKIELGNREALEIKLLAISLNKMARELDKKIKKVTKQKNEQIAIFDSMKDGVLTVNKKGKVFHYNHSVLAFFNAPLSEEHKGKSIVEVFRSTELDDLMQSILKTETEKEVEIQQVNGRILQAYGRLMYDHKGDKMGALVVLNDLTRVRELERHRKEFVSNVSHELRTPLTSIQGFVETLMDSNVDEDDRQKFLGIIRKHVERLSFIIQDLLTLSQIEKDRENREIDFKNLRVKNVLLGAIEACEFKRRKKNMQITLDCEDEIEAKIHPLLMEQAVINLIDNAIKYSEENSIISVECCVKDQEIRISVKDQGQGIAREHLPRLFERFYSVDEARSRRLGGSGLGLSIVKHIALTHGGQVSVESQIGGGSEFFISLPKANTKLTEPGHSNFSQSDIINT